MTKLTLSEMLDRTDKRQPGFNIMIEHLRSCKYPLIVETGVSRQENNFSGDGMSTLIWDAVANETSGLQVDRGGRGCPDGLRPCSPLHRKRNGLQQGLVWRPQGLPAG